MADHCFVCGRSRLLQMQWRVSGAGLIATSGRARHGAELIRAAKAPRMASRRRRSTASQVRSTARSRATAQDRAMWRPDPSGPQGPMQVSEAAATDVGGGDRFDLIAKPRNRTSVSAQLLWRYRNWPDAIAAYNWGIGKMDAWVKAGRPPDQFLVGVAVYLRRVLHESGLCDERRAGRSGNRAKSAREPGAAPPDELVYAACSAPARGPEHRASAADRAGFPESSTRRCSSLCSAPGWAGEAAQAATTKPQSQGDVPHKERQRDVR